MLFQLEVIIATAY